MNAFISYSIGHNQLYILTLLAQKLKEGGITLVTSYDQSGSVDWQAMSNVKNAALFIGVITRSGRLTKTYRVIQEFKQAQLFNKPAIMLIEDNVDVAYWLANYSNTIRFNRHSPFQAIEEVKNRITASQVQATQTNSDALAWLLGGIGVIALLSWLSENKK